MTVRGLPRERAEPKVVCRVGACELVVRGAISRLDLPIYLAYISPTSRLNLACELVVLESGRLQVDEHLRRDTGEM